MVAGRLEGKSIVVTGAGRGIGQAVARGLAAEGARVVVADYGREFDGTGERSQGPADDTVAQIRSAGGEAVAACEDIATMDGARRAVDAALDSFGDLDGLVLAAGIAAQHPLWEFPERDWSEVLRVHLNGHFACTQAALPHLMERGDGRIVCFSSSAAVSGPPQGVSYATAKAGVLGFLWSTSKALQPNGITVNAVMPGAHTRLIDNLSGDWGIRPGRPEPTSAERADPGDPELAALRRSAANVAPLVVYLVSDKANGITGQLFAASGYQITRFEQPQPVHTIRSDGPWDLDDLFRRFPEEFGAQLSLPPTRWPT